MPVRSIAGIAGLVVLVFASRGYSGDAEDAFFRAYYLESEEDRYQEALELYDQVAKAQNAPADLVARAEERRAGCLEEIQGRDLARLVPESSLAYLELRSPGKHLARLVKTLGLERVSVGGGTFALSPSLLEGLGDLVNGAVAVTDVDPRTGEPSGVAVLHLGRSELLRGVVETSLSAAVVAGELRVGEPVEGYPAYETPMGSVVLTRSLVVAGNPPQIVAETVRRIGGGAAPSLGGHPAFQEIQKEREAALAFGFVNTRLLFEKAHGLMDQQGGFPREYLLAQAVTDFESVQWLAGAVGSCEAGLSADLWARLSDTNQMLAYHLMRTPPIGVDAFQAVPAGVAALAAFGLSEGGAGSGSSDVRTETVRRWTGLDLGREVFANIRHVVAFVLPELQPSNGSRRPPIPEAALVLTVKDVGLSDALWQRLLGLAALATHAGPSAIRTETVAGLEGRVYGLPENVEIWTITLPDRLVLATGRKAIEAAVGAAKGQGSVLDDPGFAGSLGAFSATTSKVLLVHAGRTFQLARPFAGVPQEEGDQIAAALDRVSVALFTDETPVSLRVGLVAGLPQIGGMLPQLLGIRRPSSRNVGRGPVVAVDTAVVAPSVVAPSVRESRVGGASSNGVLPAPTPWDPSRLGVLVKPGASWKYLDQGTVGGIAWRGDEFGDSDWKSGVAPLGYGEDGLGTQVSFGEDVEAKRVTTYFRTTFLVQDPARYAAVRILLRRDDGAAIFLNGKEVVRDNLPPNAGPDDAALETVGGAFEGHYFEHPIPVSALRVGENTIAVEVHQANPQSSDVVFDLAVEALREVDSPQSTVDREL